MGWVTSFLWVRVCEPNSGALFQNTAASISEGEPVWFYAVWRWMILLFVLAQQYQGRLCCTFQLFALILTVVLLHQLKAGI